MIEKIFQLLNYISNLVYFAISDDEYIVVTVLGTSGLTSAYAFTGLTGRITFSSDVDIQVDFDRPVSDASLVIQGGASPVTIEVSAKELYVGAMGSDGGLRVMSQNLGTGKSDDEIRQEDRMNRRM